MAAPARPIMTTRQIAELLAAEPVLPQWPITWLAEHGVHQNITQKEFRQIWQLAKELHAKGGADHRQQAQLSSAAT